MQTFMTTRMGQPRRFAEGVQVLLAAAQALSAAGSRFNQTAALPSWTGSAKQEQQNHMTTLLSAVQRVLGALGKAQTNTTASAAQMQATKMRLDAIVATATAKQYVVLPTGQVIPGPVHHSIAAAKPYMWKVFYKQSLAYTGQITATVGQGAATDAQLATALVSVAAEFLANLMQKKSDGAAAQMPPLTSAPGPAAGPGLAASQLPAGTALPDSVGTQLAGAGELAGAGFGAGGGGLPLGGAGGVGGQAAMTGVPIGAAGIGPGAGGGVRAGAGPAGAAGRAGAGAMGAPMMPLGGHAAGGDRDSGHHDADWLREDGEPFGTDDLPDGVLS